VLGDSGGAARWGAGFVEFWPRRASTVGNLPIPARRPPGVAGVDDWRKTELKHDFIVLGPRLGVHRRHSWRRAPFAALPVLNISDVGLR